MARSKGNTAQLRVTLPDELITYAREQSAKDGLRSAGAFVVSLIPAEKRSRAVEKRSASGARGKRTGRRR